MKYFTIQWWSGEYEDQLAVFRAYDTYLAEIKPRLPGDLRRLTEDVSLHDSRLRRLTLLSASNELSIDLDGCGINPDQKSYHALKIRLAYGGVSSFESFADPDTGLPGPHGYGDLGYDEIELLDDGLLQHRMLFSTGIEFSVTFKSFTLLAEKAADE
ncbi:MAG TPA: hypothetical protein VGE76_23750 [Opitutaceae bacterium]